MRSGSNWRLVPSVPSVPISVLFPVTGDTTAAPMEATEGENGSHLWSYFMCSKMFHHVCSTLFHLVSSSKRSIFFPVTAATRTAVLMEATEGEKITSVPLFSVPCSRFVPSYGYGGYGLRGHYGKRSADAEPEAEADSEAEADPSFAYYHGAAHYPAAHYGYPAA